MDESEFASDLRRCLKPGKASNEDVLLMVNAFEGDLTAAVNMPNENGKTALMFAAQGAGPLDRVSVVEALLAAGARVNDVTSRGHSSLMFGCSRGRDDTVRALLAAGASARVRSVTGEIASELARQGTSRKLTPATLALVEHAEADEAQGAWQDWTTDPSAQAAQHEHARSCRDCMRKVAALSRSSRGHDNVLPWLQAMAAEAPKPPRSSIQDKAAVDASLSDDARTYLKAARSLVRRDQSALSGAPLALVPKDVASVLIDASLFCLKLPAKSKLSHSGSGNGGSKAAARAYQEFAAARILAPPLRCFLAADAIRTLEGCRAAALSEALAAQGQNDQRAVVGVLVTLLREAKAASRLSQSGDGGGDDDDDDDDNDEGLRRDGSGSEAEYSSADENGDAAGAPDDNDDDNNGEFAPTEGGHFGQQRRRREKIRARTTLANLSVDALAQCCDPFTALELATWRFATPASTQPALACFLCGEIGHLKRECPRNLARQPKTRATQEKYSDICPACGIARMPRYKSQASFEAHQKHCSGVPPSTASDDSLSSLVAAVVPKAATGAIDEGEDGATLTAAQSASQAHASKTIDAVRCKFFVAGKCRNGFACEFQHSLPEHAHMKSASLKQREPTEQKHEQDDTVLASARASNVMLSKVEVSATQSSSTVERGEHAPFEAASDVRVEEAGRLWAMAHAAELEWWERRLIQGPSLGAPLDFLALEAGRVIEGRRAREGGLRLEAWAALARMALVSFPFEDTASSEAVPTSAAANGSCSNGYTEGDDSNHSGSSRSELVPKTAAAALTVLSQQAASASLAKPWLRAIGQLKLNGPLKAAVEAITAGAVAATPAAHGSTAAMSKVQGTSSIGTSISLEEHLPLVAPATSPQWVDSLEALHEVSAALNSLLDGTSETGSREVWVAVDTEWGDRADNDPRGDFAPPCVLQIALAEAPSMDTNAHTSRSHNNSGSKESNPSNRKSSSAVTLGAVHCSVLDAAALLEDANAAPLLAKLVQTILGTAVRSCGSKCGEDKNDNNSSKQGQELTEAEAHGLQQQRRRRLRLFGFAFDHDTKRLATVAGWTVPPSWIGSKRRPGTKDNLSMATATTVETTTPPPTNPLTNSSPQWRLQGPSSPQVHLAASAFAFTDLQEAVRATKIWSESDSKGGPPSLRRACTCLLKQRLEKDGLQCSDWDARPLSEAQLAYAALDAEVLLRLASVLNAMGAMPQDFHQ